MSTDLAATADRALRHHRFRSAPALVDETPLTFVMPVGSEAPTTFAPLRAFDFAPAPAGPPTLKQAPSDPKEPRPSYQDLADFDFTKRVDSDLDELTILREDYQTLAEGSTAFSLALLDAVEDLVDVLNTDLSTRVSRDLLPSAVQLANDKDMSLVYLNEEDRTLLVSQKALLAAAARELNAKKKQRVGFLRGCGRRVMEPRLLGSVRAREHVVDGLRILTKRLNDLTTWRGTAWPPPVPSAIGGLEDGEVAAYSHHEEDPFESTDAEAGERVMGASGIVVKARYW